MNSDTNTSESAILFDGSLNSWLKLFQSTPFVETGAVFLICGGQRPLDSFVAGWHLFIASARKPDDTPFFTSIEHIIPGRLSNRDVLTSIKTALEKELTDMDWSRKQIKAFLESLRIHQLSSLEGPDVINALAKVQEGAAVAVSCADLYRYPCIEQDYITTATSSWLGITNRCLTLEQTFFEHLMRLTRKALNLAHERNLFVTIFCEQGPLQSEIPSDLQNTPSLIVSSLHPQGNDHQSLVQIQDWLNSLEEEDVDVDTILADITKVVKDPINQTRLKAYMLSFKGQFGAAWKEIEPQLNILTQSDGPELLFISSIALDAGRLSLGIELLTKAIEKGLESINDLYKAFLMTDRLELDQLGEKLVNRICSNYPNSEAAIIFRYNSLIKTRDFASALPLAERLNDEFCIRLCRAFIDQKFELMEFFAYAEESGQAERAYIAAAYEAEARNMNKRAKELASKIDPDSEFVPNAIKIRARLLDKTTRNECKISDASIVELKNLLELAAAHPKELDIRSSIYNILESSLDQPVLVMMLSTILLDCIITSFEAINLGDPSPQNRQISYDINPEFVETVFSRFWEEFVNSTSSPISLFGQGEIPDHLKSLVSRDLINVLVHNIQSIASVITDDDFKLLDIMLSALILASLQLDDPDSDLIAIRTAIGGLANNGYAQKARNLAETSLFLVAETQPNHLDWRTAQAWACYADAFHRTGNHLAALGWLCLCFLSWEGPAPNLLLLGSFYRLATRIFRDLKLPELALKTNDLERKLEIATGPDEKSIIELDQVELSIQIACLGHNAPTDLLFELLKKAFNLSHQSQGEMTPILSCQASLIRLLMLKGATIPNSIEEEFKKRLGSLSEPMRNTLVPLNVIAPTKEDLLSAIQQAASANSLEDLEYQITPLYILAEAAVQSACQKSDIDLFLLASMVLSQPILSLWTRERYDNLIAPDYNYNRAQQEV